MNIKVKNSSIFSLFKKIKNLFQRNASLGESSIMLFAQGFGMGLLMLVTIVKPNLLTANEIGIIAYITSIVSFMSGFFTLGIDNSIARLIINSSDFAKKRLLESYMNIIAIFLSLILGIVIVSITPIISFFGKKEVLEYIFYVFPFTGYIILRAFLDSGNFALGKIRIASIQMFIYPLLYLLCIGIFYILNMYNLTSALILEFILHFIVVLIPMIGTFKYFQIDKKLIKEIRIEQKERGWKIYFSRILFLPSFNMDVIILGAFHTLSSVTYYSMANLISSPISIIGQSVSKSMYRRFGNAISKRQIVIVTSISIAGSILIFLIGFFVVQFYLPDGYSYILILLPYSIAVAIIRGITSLYTAFMNAKGLANEVRTCAIVGLITNITFNFGLIIPFGAIGGMIAGIIVLTINLLMRIYFVNNYSRQN